jgi:hypothetical protein
METWPLDGHGDTSMSYRGPDSTLLDLLARARM